MFYYNAKFARLQPFPVFFPGRFLRIPVAKRPVFGYNGRRKEIRALCPEKERTMYRRFGKRALDLALSACGILALAPVYGIIALAIVADDPGPVFFRQKRVGLRKTHFHILKFRTMRMDTPRDVPTHLLEDPERYITRVGRVLRRTSLDELPQILQIFTGKMSIIGPRPALWNQFDLIELRDAYGANDIRPGLTGWAQINGRDELPLEVKARLDGEYTQNLSFAFDLKCFFGTVLAVFRQDGVVEGAQTQEKEKQEVES